MPSPCTRPRVRRRTPPCVGEGEVPCWSTECARLNSRLDRGVADDSWEVFLIFFTTWSKSPRAKCKQTRRAHCLTVCTHRSCSSTLVYGGTASAHRLQAAPKEPSRGNGRARNLVDTLARSAVLCYEGHTLLDVFRALVVLGVVRQVARRTVVRAQGRRRSVARPSSSKKRRR